MPQSASRGRSPHAGTDVSCVACAVQAALTADLRSSRRAKLAAVISGNSNLPGCSKDCTDQLAAAYEAHAAAGCAGDADAHKTRMLQLLSSTRAAAGWLELPDLQLLRGSALEAALKHGAAGAVAAAQDTKAAAKAEMQLQRLALLRVTADALKATGVAAAVKKLRKHSHAGVAAAAAQTIAAWRETVTQGG